MSKKNKIEINDVSFLEDLTWMSYRYCIGRHTIAAHAHADGIASNLYNVLSEDRKMIMAHDIRREINGVINNNSNIICSDYRHHIYDDGVSLIVYRMLEKYGQSLPEGFNFDDFEYNVKNGDVKIIEWSRSLESKPFTYGQRFISMYDELIPWIKLSNAFDSSCHKKITVNVNGEEKTYVAMPFPYVNGYDNTIDRKWISIESYLDKPGICSYFNDEVIVKIEDLEITL